MDKFAFRDSVKIGKKTDVDSKIFEKKNEK
jgi:hypothetical protein